MELLGRLQVDLKKFRDRFELVGRHLTDAKNRHPLALFSPRRAKEPSLLFPLQSRAGLHSTIHHSSLLSRTEFPQRGVRGCSDWREFVDLLRGL